MKIRSDFVTNSSSSSFIIVPKSEESERSLLEGYNKFLAGFKDFYIFLRTYIEDELGYLYCDEDQFAKFNELLGIELTEAQWKLITHLIYDPYDVDDLLKIKHLLESGKTAYYADRINNNLDEYEWFTTMGDEVIIQHDH